MFTLNSAMLIALPDEPAMEGLVGVCAHLRDIQGAKRNFHCVWHSSRKQALPKRGASLALLLN